MVVSGHYGLVIIDGVMRLGQDVLRAVRWAARVLHRSTIISSVDETHDMLVGFSSLDPASAVTWQLPGGRVG